MCIENKTSIFSQRPDALMALLLEEWLLPKFRVKQLCEWLYTHRIADLSQMSNLPQALKAQLQEHFDWSLPTVTSRLDGSDGATKLLLKGHNGQLFEAVILRYPGRTSLCVSSQVGCKLACRFCQTGKLGFFRHLKANEIVGQFLLANQIVRAEGRAITHIVFMGMGEPLDNFEEVVQAVELFTSKLAFGLSPRRVTVSTSGLADKILPLAERVPCSLALSLHAARDDLRSQLMPINKRFPLAVLKEALTKYQEKTGDLLTIEYILIRDTNCSRREAKELVRFLHGLRAKINLIPFNAHPGLEYQRPDDAAIREFQMYLSQRGFPAPVRYSKGLDVSAACGQLAAKQKELLHALPKRQNVIIG